MKLTWKIGGEAGFGIMTTGLSMSKIAAKLGYEVFDYIEYPSLIRGGHNAYEVIVSDEKPWGFKEEIDYLVCLNQDTFLNHKHRLTEKSFLLFDPDEFSPPTNSIKIAIPFKRILQEMQGQMIMKNTIALGASLAIMGSEFEVLSEQIDSQFNKKGAEVVDFNKKFARKGYDLVLEQYGNYCQPFLKGRASFDKVTVSGNDAFAIGAVLADCRVYCAYPMTPASSVLTTLASWQNKTNMIVRHAEDEISVINTALGSSFAGVRSSVGTSGGGFALMVESLSYAGISEIGVVVFLSQRPGPGTGMPTWTEQGDLLFSVYAGHGEFMKIVLAPGDTEEMIDLTARAFNLADIYQTPVIVLSDMFLSESHRSISRQFIMDFFQSYKVDKGKTVNETSGAPYIRYKVTEDGISDRLPIGTPKHYYQANSYEHLEDGHTTEDNKERVKQVAKRNTKADTYLKNHFLPPEVYGNLPSSKIIFVSWGSNKGAILETINLMEKKGIETAYIHFTHLFPLDVERIKPFFSCNTQYVLVENNSHAQWGQLLRSQTGIDLKEKFLKFDGRPFSPNEIVISALQLLERKEDDRPL